MRQRILVVFVGSMSLAVSVTGQEVTGSIRGRILDAPDKPAAGVQITVAGRKLLTTRTIRTNADGFFHALALPPGEYDVRAVRLGSRPVAYDGVVVNLGNVTTLPPVVLEARTIELPPVRISVRQQLIDPTRTDAGAVLSHADYAGLPSERDYKRIITIIPHVNDSHRGDPANSAGSTGLENTYFIDGVNVTSPFKAETGTSLPYNFVRAVEVKTGSYEAQYGHALGAVVNAVTYSGTNDFEVNGFAFATHSSLSATPRAEPTLRETDASNYDAGIRVSGPLKRDLIWYSAAYNPRFERVNREIEGGTVIPDRKISHVFAGKITWNASQHTAVELSVFGDPTAQDRVAVPVPVPADYAPLNPAPYRTTLATGGVVSSLRVSTFVGERFSVEASASQSRAKDNTEPTDITARSQSVFIDDVLHTVSGGGLFRSIANLRRSAATLRGTLDMGRHTTILGAEYEDNSVTRDLSQPGGFTIRRRDTARYVTIAEQANGPLHSRNPVAFINDSWRVTDAVTFSIGLRWSAQTLLGTSGTVAQRFDNEWQPRLGVVWLPGGDERRRVLASFGRYYQHLPLNLSTLWYLDYVFIQSVYSRDPREPGATPTAVFDGSTKEVDWAKSISGIEAENSDEVTLGYEQVVGSSTKLTARILHRALRSSFQFGIDPSNDRYWVIGTPGKGTFDFLPKPTREYTALELAAAGEWRAVNYRTSYVLSRNRGNYTGLYSSDAGISNPGNNVMLFAAHQALNSSGPLPNDHTHVFKISAFRKFAGSATAGGILSYETGSPLNVFATGPPDAFPLNYSFVVPRGSAGRSPSLWDLGLRFTYDITPQQRRHARMLIDLLHVGNPQRAVQLEELRYLENSGTAFSKENPGYGEPKAYQPPMMARIGIEFGF